MYFPFYSLFIIDFQKTIFFYKKIKDINRIYSLFFKEELHFIVTKYNETIHHKLSTTNMVDNKMSFIKIKKYINKIHYSRLLTHKNFLVYNFSIINLSILNYEIFAVLINFIFIIYLYTYKYNIPILGKLSLLNYPLNYHFLKTVNSSKYMYLDTLNKIQIDTAIHNNFLFMEQHCLNYDSIIEGYLNSYIHPEIIARILRKYIKDIALLHIFRNILTFLAKKNKRDTNILCLYLFYILKYNIYNIISLEIDHFILKNSSDLEYHLKKKKTFQDQIIFYQKWKTVEFEDCFLSILKIQQFNLNLKNRYRMYIYIMHYIRYGISFLLILHGNTLSILMYKRLYRFYKRRISIILIYNNVYSNHYSNNNLEYFNVFFKNKTEKRVLDIVGYSDSFFICYSIQQQYIFTPISLIIKLLYLLQLCAKNGYPIRKLSWTSINDSEIISQFQKIYEYFLFFYNGIINHTIISSLYHILNDSSLKTLAGKHKTNIKSVIDNLLYDKQVDKKLSIKYKRNLLNPLSVIIKTRVWHIDLIHQEILDLNKIKK